MRKASRNMWLIIISMSLINLYSLLYSLVLLFLPNGCHTDSEFAYNLNTITNRFLTLILWCVPIVYVFWPEQRDLIGRQKQHKSRKMSEKSDQFMPSHVSKSGADPD